MMNRIFGAALAVGLLGLASIPAQSATTPLVYPGTSVPLVGANIPDIVSNSLNVNYNGTTGVLSITQDPGGTNNLQLEDPPNDNPPTINGLPDFFPLENGGFTLNATLNPLNGDPFSGSLSIATFDSGLGMQFLTGNLLGVGVEASGEVIQLLFEITDTGGLDFGVLGVPGYGTGGNTTLSNLGNALVLLSNTNFDPNGGTLNDGFTQNFTDDGGGLTDTQGISQIPLPAGGVLLLTALGGLGLLRRRRAA